jgi:hypothetical protein
METGVSLGLFKQQVKIIMNMKRCQPGSPDPVGIAWTGHYETVRISGFRGKTASLGFISANNLPSAGESTPISINPLGTRPPRDDLRKTESLKGLYLIL